jgi:hypothetical protein
MKKLGMWILFNYWKDVKEAETGTNYEVDTYALQ